jgi:hypothetical protein
MTCPGTETREEHSLDCKQKRETHDSLSCCVDCGRDFLVWRTVVMFLWPRDSDLAWTSEAFHGSGFDNYLDTGWSMFKHIQ